LTQTKCIKEPFVATPLNSLNQPSIISQDTSNISSNLKFSRPELPDKSNLFFLITTLNDGERIYNNELKWYEQNINIQNIVKTDYNEGSHFSLNNPVLLVNDPSLPYAKGAKLNNSVLTGPLALFFANDLKTFLLTEFTIIYMMKFIDISEDVSLFEMIGNTKSQDSAINDYVYQAISIVIKSIDTNFIHIVLTFGSEVFVIREINKSSLTNDSIHIIALNYHKSELNLSIDGRQYKFDKTQQFLSLGSLPVVINSSLGIDGVLYAFAYYKKSLSNIEILAFKQFMNHYLLGAEYVLMQKLMYMRNLEDSEKKNQDNTSRLKEVSTLLNKCTVSNSVCKPNDYVLKSLSLLEPPQPSIW